MKFQKWKEFVDASKFSFAFGRFLLAYEKHLFNQSSLTMKNKTQMPCHELPPINTYTKVEKAMGHKG